MKSEAEIRAEMLHYQRDVNWIKKQINKHGYTSEMGNLLDKYQSCVGLLSWVLNFN